MGLRDAAEALAEGQRAGSLETPYSIPGALAAPIDSFSIFTFSADARPRGVDGP
jgi:hypothetical protein